MNYKIAKQLKEVGFLFKEYKGSGRFFIFEEGGKSFAVPTLEELIEEVEKLQYPLPDTGKMDTLKLEHNVTSERRKHWYAEYKIKTYNMTDEFYENDFNIEVFRCGGDTASEAVANLRLKLNENRTKT